MTLTMYKNASLIPIAREGVVPGVDLFTEGGIITRIVPSGEVLPRDAQVIDCTGKFLLPGLIDAHIHLLPGCENDLKVMAAHGITSARNMWGNQPLDLDTPGVDSQQLGEEITAGRTVGPILVNTSRILDGAQPVQACSRSVNTWVQAELFINEAIKEGATQLKVYKGLLIEVMDALYDLGKERGLRIVGHKPDRVLAEDFFSKAHSVEHTITFALEHVPALQRSKCYFVPTLVVEKVMDILTKDEGTRLAEEGQAYVRYIHPLVARLWQEASGEEMCQKIKELANFELARKKVEAYVALGGIPAAGTDFPNPYVYPGISLHEELELLQDCGLSNQQVLFAATLQGAHVLEIEDRKGTLEIGKDADLLLLNANPLDDIHNTMSIAGVALRGRYFDRPALDRLLEEAARGVQDARMQKERVQ